jgi:hypothetical protein
MRKHSGAVKPTVGECRDEISSPKGANKKSLIYLHVKIGFLHH